MAINIRTTREQNTAQWSERETVRTERRKKADGVKKNITNPEISSQDKRQVDTLDVFFWPFLAVSSARIENGFSCYTIALDALRFVIDLVYCQFRFTVYTAYLLRMYTRFVESNK